MADETPKCKNCGAELQGRDVYEGTCRACREEAILGARPPRPKEKPRGGPPPLPKARDKAVPPDAIAIETGVDIEADTKEIPSEGEAAAGAKPRHAPQPIPTPRAPAPSAAPKTRAASGDSDLPFLELRRPAGAAPAREEMEPAPSEDPVGDNAILPFTTASEPAPSQPSAPLPAAEAPSPAASGPAVRHSTRRFAPQQVEEEPRPAERLPPRAEAPKFAPLSPVPPAAATREPAREAADFGLVEDDPRDRQPPARIEPEPPVRPARAPAAAPALAAAPAVAAAPAAPAPRLETDLASGRLKSLLDDLEAQVAQLSKVLSIAHTASPRPVWFGFRAGIGFVLGLGVLAGVAAGLLALVGATVYPPALALLRRLLGS
ncbi:MAG TPA: hypothetical protein PLE19_20910 [Planctomycetota bacterium]|nr:hypothetical protein [Planctomycetota bacterium]HRR81683.1 hypothetical protein [Planctomycetota bacterium]HRT94477.1 hypothetical protein [Planctomycetota bacterium]